MAERNGSYCGVGHPDGWLCILSPHNEGDHLSIDNTRIWRGTPGYPIRWGGTDVIESALDPTTTSGEAGVTKPDRVVAQSRGYTGRPCGQCGSLNTIQRGTCLLCDDCNFSGGCG